MKRTADVLIPVYHPGKELEQLLSLLEAQDYPVNRIILMNTEEACFPAEILKDHPKAEVHHVTGRSLTMAEPEIRESACQTQMW